MLVRSKASEKQFRVLPLPSLFSHIIQLLEEQTSDPLSSTNSMLKLVLGTGGGAEIPDNLGHDERSEHGWLWRRINKEFPQLPLEQNSVELSSLVSKYCHLTSEYSRWPSSETEMISLLYVFYVCIYKGQRALSHGGQSVCRLLFQWPKTSTFILLICTSAPRKKKKCWQSMAHCFCPLPYVTFCAVSDVM